MARTKGIDSAERKRRVAQSKRDKSRKSSKPSAKGASKSSRSGNWSASRKLSSASSGVHPYTKLVLDPCKAQLTPSPLPGREGSSLFRLPFRYVVTLPTTTQALSNAAATGVTPQTSLWATLVPSAMAAGNLTAGGSAAICVSSNSYESSLPYDDTFIGTGNNTANYFLNLDPQGLSTLNSVSSLCRPIAGCIKLEFYTGANTGSFWGYEGVAGNYVRQYTSAGKPGSFVPNTTGSNMAMLGWSSGIVTEGVEAVCNYASAPTEWQEFKQLGNPTVAGSPDAADADISGMPVAVVGVGGGTSGTQYLITGAVVYEWVPSLNFGISGSGTHRPTVRKQSILDKVTAQLAAYGPMLVGVASRLATGGPTLAVSDLLYRLSINQNNSSGTSARPQIAYS